MPNYRATGTMGPIALAAAALLGAAGTAGAGDIRVDIAGLRSQAGVVRVAICPESTFTKPECPHSGVAPAGAGSVVIQGVPDGVYAVQAFHDEDSDGDLDRRGFRPDEGLAFSNDARMRRGPPRFRDAAVRVAGDGRLTLQMRYFQ